MEINIARESATVDRRISPTPRNFIVVWPVESVRMLPSGRISAAAFVTEGTGCRATPKVGAELDKTTVKEEGSE